MGEPTLEGMSSWPIAVGHAVGNPYIALKCQHIVNGDGTLLVA